MSQPHGSSIVSKDNPNQAPSQNTSNVFTDLLFSTFYTVIGYVCLDVVFGISLHYIAQHNDRYSVAGLGFAYTIVNVLLIPMAFGTNQSLNVHSAQALGANKPKLAQTYFTLTTLIHLLYFIPFSVILILIKPIIALTINEEDRQATSDASQLYLYYLLPSTLFAILYECIKSFLISNKIFAVFMYIQLFTALIHIFWCELFITYLNVGGGVPGAGLAIICTEALNLILCILVILCIVDMRFTKQLQTCLSSTKYRKKVFSNYRFKFSLKRQKKIFKSFLKESFPIIAHIYADFFVFFLLSFIAVGFGSDELYAQMALSNTSTFYYRFPMSLSLALMTFVGNEMGSQNLKRAKRYSLVGTVLFVGFTTIFMVTLTFIKEQWVDFYSAGRQEIDDIMLEVYPIFVFGFFIIDGLQGTLTGILKGIDRKDFVTYSTLLVYYLIGIPLFLYFACDFGLGLKVYGIWLSFSLVNALLAVLYIILTFTTNWDKMSQQICLRIEKQHAMQNLHDSLDKVQIDKDTKEKKSKKKIKQTKNNNNKQNQYEQASSQNNYQRLIANQVRLRGSDNEGLQYSLQETEPIKRQKIVIVDQLTSLS